MIPLSEPLPNITPLHAVSTDHRVYNRSPRGIYTCCPVQSRAKRHEKNEWRIPDSTPIFLHATQTNQPPYLKENTICCVGPVLLRLRHEQRCSCTACTVRHERCTVLRRGASHAGRRMPSPRPRSGRDVKGPISGPSCI